jgi:disulfide bond formation protein DsbB
MPSTSVAEKFWLARIAVDFAGVTGVIAADINQVSRLCWKAFSIDLRPGRCVTPVIGTITGHYASIYQVNWSVFPDSRREKTVVCVNPGNGIAVV